tara:strand:+ start:325 stop:786 length:462 start_codon:yes stop_codon:yes gene_type:complete
MGHDSSNTNAAIVDQLKQVLATSYSLYVKTHNYHWNVEGPHFHTLHVMFEEQYTELAGAVDEIAERIRAIGAYAPGSFKEFGEMSKIDKPLESPVDAMKMVKDLAKSHETLAEIANDTIEVASESGDEVSLDLMVQRKTAHDKTAWMLNSLLK